MAFIYREQAAKYWVELLSDSTSDKTQTVQLQIIKVIRSSQGKFPPIAGNILTVSRDATLDSKPWDVTKTAIPDVVLNTASLPAVKA